MKSLALLGGLVLPLAAPAYPLSVVTDLSGSAPLLVNERFAKLAAYAAVAEFDQLKSGDKFTFRTLGVTGFKNFGATAQVVKRNKKKKMRKQLFKQIAYIPKDKTIESQGATNLLYFLNYTDFNCAEGENIFIVTDAIESSNYIDGNSLLMGSPLPKPEADFLKGCKIIMYGMGLTVNPIAPDHLKNMLKAWQDWAVIAGVEFKAVINP
jgi:hypothetical protein